MERERKKLNPIIIPSYNKLSFNLLQKLTLGFFTCKKKEKNDLQ